MLTIIATLNFCFTTRLYTSNAVRQIKARRTSVVVKNMYVCIAFIAGRDFRWTCWLLKEPFFWWGLRELVVTKALG